MYTMFIPSAFPRILPLVNPLQSGSLPFYAYHYLLAMLAILPHMNILRLAFVPVVLWKVWYCRNTTVASGLLHSSEAIKTDPKKKSGQFSELP